MKSKNVRPLVFMVNLEPIELLDENFSDKIPKDVKFDLSFSIFRVKKKYEVSYVIGKVTSSGIPIIPEILTNVYDDLNDPACREFVGYKNEVFKPFKRAILTFEDKPYSHKEFSKIMADWKENIFEIKDC